MPQKPRNERGISYHLRGENKLYIRYLYRGRETGFRSCSTAQPISFIGFHLLHTAQGEIEPSTKLHVPKLDPDSRDWRMGDSQGRKGIWLSLAWETEFAGRRERTWVRPTDAQPRTRDLVERRHPPAHEPADWCASLWPERARPI